MRRFRSFGRIHSRAVDEDKLSPSSELSPEAAKFLRECVEDFGRPFDQSRIVTEEIFETEPGSSRTLEILRQRSIVTFLGKQPDPKVLSAQIESVRGLVLGLKQGDSSKGRNDGFRLARDGEKYQSMAQSELPVVSLRGGVDAGMADIFHGERLFPDLGDLVLGGVDYREIEDLLGSATGKSFRFSNFNLYVNDSVTSTRGWHVDSYGGRQYKAFMYLTDVPDLEHGPYCYVVDSPTEPGFEEANLAMSRVAGLKPTDIAIFRRSKAIPLLAKAGQIVVSNQSGAHRGYPQASGAFRCIAALNFREL